MKVALIYNKQEIHSADVIDLFGPPTKEKYNPKTVEKVAESLEHGGHNVKVIEGNIGVVDELRHFMPRVVAGERPGMVFNMAYGIQGQSRYTHIPAMLEMLGVPYVGSGPQAHAVALDKIMSKIVFSNHNISTPEFWFFNSRDDDMEAVTYPVIVKPKMESVSMGLRIVDNIEDLREAVDYVVETFQQSALVERFISGREFAVGLLGNGADLEILPIVEFNFGGDPDAIQSEDNKKKQPVEKVCPAEIPDELAEEMRNLARNCFHALGISDFARIDVRMDAEGRLYVLELNSMASLGATGSYFKAATVAGYSYEGLVNRMLDVAAVRYFGQTFEEDPSEELPDQPLRVKVRSHARSQLTTMLDNLREMVEINTHVYNAEGVNSLGTWMSRRLTGFQQQIFPQTEVGNILYFTNHTEDKNDILLLAHLDTYYSYQDFVMYREERGRIFGSGVAECKGGLAVMLEALQALRYTRRIKKIRIGILLTTDDSLGGRYSHKHVTDLARRSSYVVGLKYGDVNGGVVTSSSGEMRFNFELTNSKVGEEVQDVIKTACEKVVAWQKLTNKEQNLLVKPLLLEARTLAGYSPDYATGALQVEFKDIAQGEAVEKKFRQIGEREKRIQVRMKRSAHRPPMAESDLNQQFFGYISGIAKRLEIKVAPAHRSTPSDICHVPATVPALGGLGPIGADVRSPREYVVRDSLVDRAALLAMLIRLSAEKFK